MIFALGIVLALLPSLTWLFFYLKEDPHPEPPRWLWLAFFLGIGAAALSFYIERAILKISSLTLQQPETVISEALIFMIFGVALVEEVTKFLGARMLLAKNPVFDEPVDAMIYLI
ncbi:MAG: PrsW family intramembrane metalloprotease, partial [Parcubacteria group bacterium]|nr:PrsW family intramembrane metalloprotease [Parcubacteria group bacterium]